MAGYVKIWTTLCNKPEFLSASSHYRGLYLQLLLWCKNRDDSGVLTAANWTDLGSLLACERRTAGNFLGKFQSLGFLSYEVTNEGAIVITIPKYKHWQEIDVKEVVSKTREKSRKIPLIPEQTRADQSRAYIGGQAAGSYGFRTQSTYRVLV